MTLVTVLLLASPVIGAGAEDEVARLKEIAASGWEVRALAPQEYTDAVEREVGSWIQPPGDAPPKPVRLARGYKFGDGFVVEEQTTGQWLLATPTDKPGQIGCAGRYVSFAALVESNRFAPPPKVPAGWKLREVARMPRQPTRLASDRTGRLLYVLTLRGDVYKLDPADGSVQPAIERASYLRPDGEYSCMGLCFDAQDRLYIVTNFTDTQAQPQTNRVTIFRTSPITTGNGQLDVKPWLEASYPFGIDVFNHGVGHIALGPDGLLYVNSGSRTDHGESGNDPRRGREGETPITACLWRLDPHSDHPQVEVFASGLRNAYGFCWDDRGRMLATDNGPNENAPEELNLVEHGKHYGFPYKFADLKKSPYPDTPPTPPGLQIELPIVNVGPDGGAREGRPYSTFEDHSSPAGIVHLDSRFPPHARGSFLVVRFGNLLAVREVGQDLFQVRLVSGEDERPMRAEVKTLLAGLSRPIDVHVTAGGRIFVLEVFRKNSEMPGRVWELSAE